jgi:colanic acid/amylovoran biosynthesis glycosyltransferase
MKITYIVNLFPRLSETFVLNQITGLIDRGHDVQIISMGRSTDVVAHRDVEKYNLLERTQYVDQRPLLLGFKLNETLLKSFAFTDLIHAHFAARNTDLALMMSNMFGVPFVFTAHAFDIFKKPNVKRLREKFEKAAKAITISNYNREYLLKLLGRHFAGKIEVIRCGIDLETFRYKERTPKNITRILFVGRLVEKKGINYAVEAFGEVIKKYPDTELRIIGEGPMMVDVVNRINALDLKEKIVLLGPRAISEVLKEMEAADIFFLPSVTAMDGDREGVPVSIMEAQAVGLPVVSTLHTGIPELVADGKSGFLVAEKDTRAMAESLKRLIKDPGLRTAMGKEGRKHIEATYDRKMELDRLEGLFTSLLKNRTPLSDIPEEQLKTIKQKVKNPTKQFCKLNGRLKALKWLQIFVDAVKHNLTYEINKKFITPLRRFKKH